MPGFIICADNVSKVYGNGDAAQYALKHVSLSVPQGEFLSITGESGSGKSTLLNMLGLLDRPTEGTILLNDINTAALSPDACAENRSRKIGFIFQAYHLEPAYTAAENIQIPLLIADVKKKLHEEMIDRALYLVGLSHKKRAIVRNLSGGEKQRIGIARAIVTNPEIILADEPCGNLDSDNSEKIMNLLRKLADDGKTIILVTHNPNAARLTDRIITMRDGVIISDETQ